MTRLDKAFLEDLGSRQFKVKGQLRTLPVGKAISMLVRPSFIAPIGRRLVWGDWSAIEARVLPWLAASPGAEKVLDIFRESDHDKTKPDIYMRTACDLIDADPVKWWALYRAKDQEAKDLRQGQGKVPVLSLGFGGALGALQAMAINYGVYLDEERARWVVDTWRAKNPWARQFWGKHDRDGSSGLWGAANSALENPGDAFAAGRVAYVYDKDYLGGTLFCALPCGRLLSYPDIKWRTRTFKDKKTGEEVEKTALWFKKGYGYSALWYGKLAENVTQAVAGSILRETLVYLEDILGNPDLLREVLGGAIPNDPEWMVLVGGGGMDDDGHTHDEIVAEVLEQYTEQARKVLHYAMETWKPAWRETLPLVAEITDHEYYTKSLD